MNALIVDDCRITRAVFSRTLSRLGIGSSEACDGEEALSVLSSGARFDLVLIDWDMPNLSGIELLRQLRADARYEALKLVMVTCHTDRSDIEAAISGGADEFIMKPATIDVIESKLRLLWFDLPERGMGAGDD